MVSIRNVDVEHVVGLPHPRLRPFVTRYSGYRMRSEPGVHRGLPSRSLTLVVTIDGTVDLPEGSFASLCGGLHDEAVIITHDGFQHGVQCDLTPLGARAFFGLPAAELAAVTVGLDVLDAPAAELRDRLQTATTWTDRFAHLDFVLGGLVRPVRQQVEVAWAWQRLGGGCGGRRHRRRGRVEQAAPQREVRRRVRPDAQGRGAGDAVRAGEPDAARRAPADVDRGGRRLRLHRPGALQPGLAGAVRGDPDRVDGGGASIRTRQRAT